MPILRSSSILTESEMQSLFFLLMNLCGKPHLNSTLGVNVIKTTSQNARKLKTRKSHAESSSAKGNVRWEPNPARTAGNLGGSLYICSQRQAAELAQRQWAAAAHRCFCCMDDGCSSQYEAEHHKQGPLLESCLARFDSHNWDPMIWTGSSASAFIRDWWGVYRAEGSCFLQMCDVDLFYNHIDIFTLLPV